MKVIGFGTGKINVKALVDYFLGASVDKFENGWLTTQMDSESTGSRLFYQDISTAN